MRTFIVTSNEMCLKWLGDCHPHTGVACVFSSVEDALSEMIYTVVDYLILDKDVVRDTQEVKDMLDYINAGSTLLLYRKYSDQRTIFEIE